MPPPTAITLADLPPDIIRAIVLLVEDPFETGMRLISHHWNTLADEYLNQRYRPIESIEIAWTGYDIKIEITLHKSDVNHFQLDQWEQSKLDRQLRNTNLVKISTPDYMIAPKLYIDDCENEVCSYLKKIARSCSWIRWLSINRIKASCIAPICASLGSARVKSISTSGIGVWKIKAEMEELARKRKTETLSIGGQFITLKY